MKRHTAQRVLKAEEDIEAARSLVAQAKPPRDIVCFHCQQAAEKYLKALLQELGLSIPYTHDLEELLDLLVPHDTTLKPLRRDAAFLTRFCRLLSLSRCARPHTRDAFGPSEVRTRPYGGARQAGPTALIATQRGAALFGFMSFGRPKTQEPARAKPE
jgi:HEPN domain-containing protein